jgi:hypothetical protein
MVFKQPEKDTRWRLNSTRPPHRENQAARLNDPQNGSKTPLAT